MTNSNFRKETANKSPCIPAKNTPRKQKPREEPACEHSVMASTRIKMRCERCKYNYRTPIHQIMTLEELLNAQNNNIFLSEEAVQTPEPPLNREEWLERLQEEVEDRVNTDIYNSPCPGAPRQCMKDMYETFTFTEFPLKMVMEKMQKVKKLKRRALQKLAKKLGIQANMKTVEIIRQMERVFDLDYFGYSLYNDWNFY